MDNFSQRKIIFDFDGVIVDSMEVTRGLTRRLDKVDIGVEEYRDLFLGNIFEVGAKNKFTTFDNAETKAAYYREYNMVLAPLAVIPGIPELLSDFSKRYPLHIVSSADAVSIRNFLRANNLEEYFQSVLGYETDESKVAKFKMLNLHERPESHLFITDTLGDLKEAAKIGLPAIAVSWGVHDADRLSRGESRAIVHTVSELRHEVDRWWGGL